MTSTSEARRAAGEDLGQGLDHGRGRAARDLLAGFRSGGEHDAGRGGAECGAIVLVVQGRDERDEDLLRVPGQRGDQPVQIVRVLIGRGLGGIVGARAAVRPARVAGHHRAVGGIPVQTGAQPLREPNTDQNKPNKY
jgi:hypothetical protein